MISDESSLIHVMPLHKDGVKKLSQFGARFASYILVLAGRVTLTDTAATSGCETIICFSLVSRKTIFFLLLGVVYWVLSRSSIHYSITVDVKRGWISRIL